MKRLAAQHTALHYMLDHFLTVEMIAEPLETIDSLDTTEMARQVMEAKHFDVLGLADADGKVIGYVKTDSLREGQCMDPREDFNIGEIVSLHTALQDCLPHLCSKQRLFVLGRHGIEAIITVADLQKQPARLMLFGVVSLLEMVLLEWVRQQYPCEEWKDLLTPKRLEGAQRLWEERRKKNQEIDLVDCLQLCDKATVLTKTGELCAEWSFQSKTTAREFFHHLQNLRDCLAHAQDPTKSMDWPQIIDLMGQARTVTEKILGMVGNENTKDDFSTG